MRHPLTRLLATVKISLITPNVAAQSRPMPISLLSRFIPVGNQNINRFVKSVGIMRVQGDQSLEII